MKQPEFDWENSSGAFRAAFEEWDAFSNLSRDDVEEIVTADVARAQRMAAAGLRHLRAILGARTKAGIRDRWRKDALAERYFGKTSSVANMKAVRRRLERAHRRLRDDRLHIRMRPQSAASTSTTDGRNDSFFLAPRRFELYPDYARSTALRRSATIVHELLHEWLRDQKIGNDTVYSDDETQELARRDPTAARRSPANFDKFLQAVWEDEGLDAPSGAVLEDKALPVSGTLVQNATGHLRDRPVLAELPPHGRRDMVLCGLRAQDDEAFVPALFEVDATPILRRHTDAGARGHASYPPACCTLTNGVVIVATRSPKTRRMELRAFDIEDERIVTRHDSGTMFRDCFSQPDAIALGPHRFCLVYKIKNGRMRVELMEYHRESGFRRIAHAETHSAIRDHGRAVLVSPIVSTTGEARSVASSEFVVATVFRTREGKLSFDLWTLDTWPADVTRRGGLVDHDITGRPGLAMAARQGRWVAVAAARDKNSGRLRLTAFDPSDPARPRRLGDTGDDGARMTHSPDIVTVRDGARIAVATAIRYVVQGRAIVSLWNAGTRDKLFRRVHDSGWRDSPILKGSPSLVALPEFQPPRLLTAAVGPDDRLSLTRWQVKDPVRTNG